MAYILKRLGYYLLAFWASVTLNFLLPRLMPGDPVSRMFARSGARLTQTQALQLRRLFGLDDAPLWQQYLRYLKSILTGDLGVSISRFPAPVSEVIGSQIGWTVLLGGLSLGICALALYRSRSGGRKKLEFVCLWGTVYLLAGLAAINIIKAVWQRTRFDDMLTAAGGGFEGAFAQFTSWMQPFGNGGSSFPSGHTAAACSVFILTLACDVCLKWNRRRTLVWALCWAYVAFMALCRLVIGRHYLSDTLAAAFVMLLLYLGMRKTKWYRAGARELTAPDT